MCFVGVFLFVCFYPILAPLTLPISPKFGENSSIVSLSNFSAPHSTFFLSGTLMIQMLDLLLPPTVPDDLLTISGLLFFCCSN